MCDERPPAEALAERRQLLERLDELETVIAKTTDERELETLDRRKRTVEAKINRMLGKVPDVEYRKRPPAPAARPMRWRNGPR